MTPESGKFPLFKGATRLPTWLGVPRIVLGVTLMFWATTWMTIHLWALGGFALSWFVEWCISKHDDRMFRILWLGFRSKVVNRINSPFTKKWKGSSYSPIDYGARD